jgi:hypothetical protein
MNEAKDGKIRLLTEQISMVSKEPTAVIADEERMLCDQS